MTWRESDGEEWKQDAADEAWRRILDGLRPRGVEYYTLDAEGNPVPAPDVLSWGRWLEENPKGRRVAYTEVTPEVFVSTVFLGLDHRFGDKGPPLIFETMIFGGERDQFQDRYSTRAEALAGHAHAVEVAQAAQREAERVIEGLIEETNRRQRGRNE